MLGSVMCSGGSVYGVFAGRREKKKQDALSAEDFVPADTVAVSDIIEGLTARSAVVTEMTTGRVLFEKEPQEQCECGHYAKLMVLLLTAEKIDCGELSMNDMAVVSEYANSQQGSQIWLDKGEKISVEELIKSVSAGNANDGCAALAEKVAGSAVKAVELMNSRAKMLGMNGTVYTDCTWHGRGQCYNSKGHGFALLGTCKIQKSHSLPYLLA